MKLRLRHVLLFGGLFLSLGIGVSLSFSGMFAVSPATASAPAGAASRSPDSAPPDFTEANDRLFAEHLGDEYGDPKPASLSTVSGDRGDALKVIAPGETVEGVPLSTPVHVITMSGEFSGGSHPPDGPAPHGKWLTVAIDAATGAVLDLSLTNSPPPLERLGAVANVTP